MAGLDLTYHRLSFFEYLVAEKRIYVNPAFSYRRGDGTPEISFPACDYVFATHGEPISDVIEELDTSKAIMVASPSLCREVRDALDLPLDRFIELRDGESARESRFRVEAYRTGEETAKATWPRGFARPGDFLGGLATLKRVWDRTPTYGLTFEFGDLRVHHIGKGFDSTTDWNHLEAVAEDLPADIMVCVAYPDSERDVAEGVEILAPKMVLIHHPHERIYRRLSLQNKPLTRFERFINRRSPEVEVVKLRPESRIDLTQVLPKARSVRSAPPAPKVEPKPV